jgi:hypothetical protein
VRGAARLTRTSSLSRYSDPIPEGRPRIANVVGRPSRLLVYRGVKKPVTVPAIMPVPSGPEKRVWGGIVQVTVFAIGAAFAEVSVSTMGAPPPEGVNVKVRSNAVGMKTDVLPMTCAGENVPLPFTTTVTGWPLHVAVI